MRGILNYCKLLPSWFHHLKIADPKDLINDENGQTMIEFVLLFLIIVLVSMSFISVVNSNVADYWIGIVNVIIDDPSITIDI